MFHKQKLRVPALIMLLAAIPVLQSCFKDKHIETLTYTANSPVYMSDDEFKTSVKMEGPRAMHEPGKIYLYDNTLYINEVNQGVHVVNNTNPSNPQKIGFINIPGNIDIAIKGNALYADSYTDLITLDISDPNNVIEVSREEDVFQYTLPSWNSSYPLAQIDPSRGVVVGWEVKEVSETCEDGECGWRPNFVASNSVQADEAGFSTFAGIGNNSRISVVGSGVGQAGSMARFMLHKDYLYIIDTDFSMSLYNTVDPMQPSYSTTASVGNNIETLFVNEDKLFIGSETGMFIYDLSTPENPTYVSQFEHAQGCDPVVVYGNTAYVTIRGGTPCGGFDNQLDVIDITNINNPTLITSASMDSPFGLGVDGTRDVLFVCDGSSGLKVFDTKNREAIPSKMIENLRGFHAFDAITQNGLLLMTGADGLYQFDYNDPQNVSMVSVMTLGE